MLLWLLSFFSEAAAARLVLLRHHRAGFRAYEIASRVTKKNGADGGMGELCEPFPASAK